MSSRSKTRQSSRKRPRLGSDGDAGVESPGADHPESIPNGPAAATNHHDPVPRRASSSTSLRKSKATHPPGHGHSHTHSHSHDTENATASSPTTETTATASASPSLKELVGYCFCRDWRVIIRDPVAGVVVCHCKDCQAISSSFFCTYVTAKSRAELTVEPTDRTARNVTSSTFYYTITEGENTGKRQSRTFCSRCGTVLFATPESLEGALPINRNLFLTPENANNKAIDDLLSPKMEIFVRDRNTWRPGDKGIIHEWEGMPGHL